MLVVASHIATLNHQLFVLKPLFQLFQLVIELDVPHQLLAYRAVRGQLVFNALIQLSVRVKIGLYVTLERFLLLEKFYLVVERQRVRTLRQIARTPYPLLYPHVKLVHVPVQTKKSHRFAQLGGTTKFNVSLSLSISFRENICASAPCSRAHSFSNNCPPFLFNSMALCSDCFSIFFSKFSLVFAKRSKSSTIKMMPALNCCSNSPKLLLKMVSCELISETS
ncbi:hypothetical protein BpHYR1_005131 [Brachionus plicatilis]|uniref:Uncharacterized protein n=1 Tax=Brachionus plicatilis TaxID=10195 RepID=A0A3M7SP32_BRAPC|nr:hypothetical protein BpHYR1_005131 [Brachionus plicatilis]